ncbi:hypothetical protein GOP47_0025411 [Adiantum capillus-veneris]|uniref:PPM-type phosphatase domain-containing protein n=1 Tax=Adiantum capillus-veneris TaxID=13818 RepID=A0A9D4Z3J8_ADICA|nr:hypothetical protein GOP47_0025411 [Adiantum capillus-veneris]
MGNVVGCFVPAAHDRDQGPAPFVNSALDEGLGHSFCYVRPSSEAINLSPSHSDRYASELHSSSFRSHRTASESVAFRTISGASVSANTSTPHTILSHEQLHSFANVPDDRHAAFESSGSFVSIPLQPVPRGVTFSGPISSTFSGPMSAPLERVFRSGPLELSHMSGPIDLDHTHFSAPLAGPYNSKRLQRRRNLSRLFNAFGKPVKGALSKTITSTLARTHRSLVVPVRQFVWRRVRNGGKEAAIIYDSGSELRYASSEADPLDNHNLQWAQGKAGEDRVHVVVSEDHGWLFVGIYDGFNGPDAPDFLMRNLYTAVYRELQGLLWDAKGDSEQGKLSDDHDEDGHHVIQRLENGGLNTHSVKNVSPSRDTSICSNQGNLTRSRTLKEYLESTDSDVEDSTCDSGMKHEGRSLSMPLLSREVVSCSRNPDNGEQSQAVNITNERANDSAGDAEDGPGNGAVKFSDNVGASNYHVLETTPSTLTGRRFPLPSLGHKQMKKKESHRKFLPQRDDLSCDFVKSGTEHCTKDGANLWKQGADDHDNVLKALSRALQETEEAYLNMADLALEDNPELLLMGSCILVALVKEKDVYILNVGDSRAIVAQELDPECSFHPHGNTGVTKINGFKDAAIRNDLECISEDSEFLRLTTDLGPPTSSASLFALQLSQDHSTSIEEEVQRIKLEHPNDNMCIFNDRVKGRLKVTRAFGAGFLKKPRWNNAVLKMFQIDYVGSDPYVTCAPALRHHRLGPNDRFLVLSSDGLYQYFSNKEVVCHVEWFMQKFPEGDPAQHLIEELLFRAAKKAGMDFHELLDIPQGDRRKYHDDVSVMVISLEGKVWKSSS